MSPEIDDGPDLTAPETVPGYPWLRKHAVTSRGYATILEVSRTSDGWLIGWVRFETGEGETFEHSVFLGAAEP